MLGTLREIEPAPADEVAAGIGVAVAPTASACAKRFVVQDAIVEVAGKLRGDCSSSRD